MEMEEVPMVENMVEDVKPGSTFFLKIQMNLQEEKELKIVEDVVKGLGEINLK